MEAPDISKPLNCWVQGEEGRIDGHCKSEVGYELQRITRSESYDEQPMPELNSEAIDFRVASELFSEYRKLSQSNLETLKLTIINFFVSFRG